MSTDYAVEARGLIKRYGTTTALGGIDLEVPTGTVTAVLGPNGAGKTTAVRILTTLTEADEGEAVVAGFDVRTQATEVRRRIGLAAQDATVDPLLTGRENLVMLGELHQLSRKDSTRRAVELLAEFALTEAADRVVSGYSGGMRRRLDLGATLVARPEVLFLDEPTTGLDPRARTDLWSVLDTLVDHGATLLLTTQYLEEAERLADDIIVVDHGKIIARGDARKLKRQVGGDHVQIIVVEPDQLDDATRILARITGAQPTVDVGTRSVTAPTSQGVQALVIVASALTDAARGGRRSQPAPADARRGVPHAYRRGPRRRSHGGDHMTITATAEPVVTAPAHHLHPPRGMFHDTWVIARRGLVHMKRQPEQLSDATIQPIMFVLLFAYVFGGAIDVPGGGSYREFLMGGIFAQTIVFTAFGVALSLANDRKNQAVDRFRSLPIAKGAVLGGHAVANLLKSFLPIALMSLCGLAIGWRIRSGLIDAVGGYALLIAFAFAMIWVGVLLGSLVATPEGVTGIAFTVLFPITFIASTFVPTSTMPGFLQTIAEWNPVTTLSDAVREQFGNPNTPAAPGDPWSIAHPMAYSVIWIVAIVAVCAPLAVRAYQRSIAK